MQGHAADFCSRCNQGYNITCTTYPPRFFSLPLIQPLSLFFTYTAILTALPKTRLFTCTNFSISPDIFCQQRLLIKSTRALIVDTVGQLQCHYYRNGRPQLPFTEEVSVQYCRRLIVVVVVLCLPYHRESDGAICRQRKKPVSAGRARRSSSPSRKWDKSRTTNTILSHSTPRTTARQSSIVSQGDKSPSRLYRSVRVSVRKDGPHQRFPRSPDV